jgi:hypothetical protein
MGRRSRGRLLLNASKLKRLHPAVIREVLRRAFLETKGDLRRIDFKHIESAADLLRTPGHPRCLRLPGTLRVQGRKGVLQIDTSLK